MLPKLTTPTRLRLRGAAEHNLKSVDLDLPLGRLIAFSGVSGSGKSSLAFDTILAEGQRRYLAAMGDAGRGAGVELQRPQFDALEGLPPTVGLRQLARRHHPRSNLGTLTGTDELLRVLFARLGQAHCWAWLDQDEDEPRRRCGQPLCGEAPHRFDELLATLSEGTRLELLAPLRLAYSDWCSQRVSPVGVAHAAADARTLWQAFLASLRNEGFTRVRVVDTTFDLSVATELDNVAQRADGGSTPALVIDRLRVRRPLDGRSADSLATALRWGVAELRYEQNTPQGSAWSTVWFSAAPFCPRHPHCRINDLEPRQLSPLHAEGACSVCGGRGTVGGRGSNSNSNRTNLGKRIDANRSKSTESSSKRITEAGTGPLRVDAWHRETEPGCPECLGSGLGPIARGLTLRWPRSLPMPSTLAAGQRAEGWHFAEASVRVSDVAKLSLHALRTWLDGFDNNRLDVARAARGMPAASEAAPRGALAAKEATTEATEATEVTDTQQTRSHRARIAAPLIKELGERLQTLTQLGLSYLTLGRREPSLSTGEYQRARLAAVLASPLDGVAYVLDEPSAGLHPQDKQALLSLLLACRDRGNTVIMVEHARELLLAADHLVDLGPGAGPAGGTVVAQGDSDDLAQVPASLTGTYLSGKRLCAIPLHRRPVEGRRHLVLTDLIQHNLRIPKLSIPLRCLVGVCGVSGAGKSTLLFEEVLPRLQQDSTDPHHSHPASARVAGAEHLRQAVVIDSRQLLGTPRSTVATALGLLDPLRRLFAASAEARARGFRASRFSYNNKEGRCPRCEGLGAVRIAMHLLPDLELPCERCRGLRYEPETLRVTYRGRHIGHTLGLSVREALGLFPDLDELRHPLRSLEEVGLGYLELGRPTPTLSGGEAQRLRLAAALSEAAVRNATDARRRRRTRSGTANRSDTAEAGTAQGTTLYLLDEPDSGLHCADLERLIRILHRLVDEGQSVVFISHHPELLAQTDWLIELGPGSGPDGGRLVRASPPRFDRGQAHT